MPFGECTITLQDLAYQFGLPINGHAVSRCLSNFEPLMEGRKPVWNKFRDLPANASEATVQIYARDYIMMLLSTALFADKSSARVHLRWLPYVADLGGLRKYNCLRSVDISVAIHVCGPFFLFGFEPLPDFKLVHANHTRPVSVNSKVLLIWKCRLVQCIKVQS
ncbi:hypothetical protein Ahy_B08g093919 [Arachis hypogaea]|uniref:Aminotransferase-like plant mobile domain-containing protein n=1 Tax=Arachis hypogaea TaxID=3818 RepID=A0A444Y7C6_ARAHY|nr:hypothetical protein Ahy_B08g093919 [Arachis hypogaea]